MAEKKNDEKESTSGVVKDGVIQYGETRMICSYCGEEIKSNDTITVCPYCNTPISENKTKE